MFVLFLFVLLVFQCLCITCHKLQSKNFTESFIYTSEFYILLFRTTTKKGIGFKGELLAKRITTRGSLGLNILVTVHGSEVLLSMLV